MSKKDYVLIAAVFNEQHALYANRDNEPDRDAATGIRLLARALADALRRDNARFDRSRFLVAAGVAE